MNNIFGQPNNNCGCHQNPYTIPCPHPHPQPHPHPIQEECRQQCGTVFRINIPAGAAINILNLVELTSPSGICLILRLPFLSGECKDC